MNDRFGRVVVTLFQIVLAVFLGYLTLISLGALGFLV